MTLHDPKLAQSQTSARKVADWFEAYYTPAPVEKCTLREMSALEQMYAYYEA